VWLRVRILKFTGLQFNTTVQATRDSLRDAVPCLLRKLRSSALASFSGHRVRKVSSADMDCVGLLGITSLLSDAAKPAVRRRRSDRTGP